MKKILVVYTDRFSKRNIETSTILKSLQKSFEVKVIDFEIYSKRPLLHKIISNPLAKILQFRFSEIHQFKKHLLKKKYKDLFQVNNYDKVDSKFGFPFPKSKFLFNFLFGFQKKLTSFFKIDFKPDLILITGCQEGFAQYILKWSFVNKIPVICMVNSWDHLTFRGPAYFYPNIQKYLVWGEIQKEELTKFHNIQENLITIIGSLQFDLLYEYKNNITTRSQLGLKDEDFVVFVPTYNERHGFNEPIACEKVIELLLRLNIAFKLVLRPYPKDTTFKKRFHSLLNNSNVIVNEINEDYIQDRIKQSLFLKHCNVIICGPGTVAIEAMYFNKPVIFLAMETRDDFKNINIARERYFTDHLVNVIKPGGSYFCDNFLQLEEYIKNIIEGKVNFSEIQNDILKKQIFSLNGDSSILALKEIIKSLDT